MSTERTREELLQELSIRRAKVLKAEAATAKRREKVLETLKKLYPQGYQVKYRDLYDKLKTGYVSLYGVTGYDNVPQLLVVEDRYDVAKPFDVNLHDLASVDRLEQE